VATGGSNVMKRKEHKIINGVSFKECSKCKEWKELTLFRKDKGKWDGLYPYCKECANAKDRNIYKKNPEKKKQAVKDYMEKHPEKYNIYKPYNPKYYSSEKSRLKKRARDMKRRALKKEADLHHQITDEVIKAVLEKYNNCCVYCGENVSEKFHIDHKLPLSRGGGNEIENLALSCPDCNYKKNNKTDIEFVGKPV
jgi:hypothetical protein